MTRRAVRAPLLAAGLLASGLLVLPAAPGAAATGCTMASPKNGAVTGQPWAVTRLALPRVWPLTQGAGVVVGVVDSGVDARHPLLAGRVLSGVDEVAGPGPATVDCVGHGTFVAGLIAAARRPGAGFAGVAPRATILPIRQTATGQDGDVRTLVAGIRDAVRYGAKVINVSVVYGRPSAELAAAVADAQRNDVVVVAAAGNDAGNGNPVLYPAAYPGVLAVGAIGPDGQVTQFSETGTGVSVVAPGAGLSGPAAGGTGLVGGRQGTSYAAPFVAGVAALVRAYRPGLRAAQVVHRIEVTADHQAGTPDPRYGWGVVNPYRAVTQELPEEYGPEAASGAQPGATRLPVPRAAPPGPTRPGRTLLAVLGLLALAALIAVFSALARRRRPG